MFRWKICWQSTRQPGKWDVRNKVVYDILKEHTDRSRN